MCGCCFGRWVRVRGRGWLRRWLFGPALVTLRATAAAARGCLLVSVPDRALGGGFGASGLAGRAADADRGRGFWGGRGLAVIEAPAVLP